MNKLIEMLANDYPDSEHRMTVVDFADWLKEKMAGYRLVPVEPTREMWVAAGNEIVSLQDSGATHHDKLAEAVWTSMLAAVPDHSEQVRQMVKEMGRE